MVWFIEPIHFWALLLRLHACPQKSQSKIVDFWTSRSGLATHEFFGPK
jgi:hypothetical protein